MLHEAPRAIDPHDGLRLGLLGDRFHEGARAAADVEPAAAARHIEPAQELARDELVIELASAAVIEGVVLRDGKPAAGATVTFSGSGEPVATESGPTGGFAAEVVVSGGVVTGTVLDARSVPLPGAWVAAFRGAGPRPNSGWTVADATGRYVLPLAPGSYGLTASPARPDRRPDPSAVIASATVVAGGQSNVDLVVPDDPQPTLSGVVLEPGGAPSPGAAVRLIPSGSQPQLVIAGDDGSFQSAVPDGDGAVSARNGGRLGNAAAAAPATGLVVQLAPAASIAGRLVGDPAPETSSLSASTLDAMQARRGAGTVQFVGATFSLTDVAPGQLALHVATDDGRVGDARATIAPGGNRSLDVTLSAAAIVSGRVVSAATGQPVTLVRITVDGQPRRRGLGADGRFRIAVTEGPRHLGIAALGYAAIARDVTASAASAVDLGDLALDAAAPPPSTTGR